MIISILGTSGAFKNRNDCTPVRDENGDIKFQSAKYNSQKLGKPSGTYKNATEYLLNNFDDKFLFIGTKCAIEFQQIILEESMKNRDITYVEIKDESLDDIFEKILEVLNINEEIILDITHGFRHQPIMAIFASTLSQFLQWRNLRIIFAKEIEMFKEYTYIYLDDYIEITQISLLLTGFIRTLNFIPVSDMKLLNNKVFENFSKSLLSNDMKGVERNYILLKKELERLEQDKELKHINNLIKKVKQELTTLDMLPFFEPYQKYIVLSKLMVDKNYLVVALAYIFESIREYCSYRFESICANIKFKDNYTKNDNVMRTIGNFEKGNIILRKHKNLYTKNKEEFRRVNKLYNRLRIRRNSLAHINTTDNFDDIKKDLKDVIKKVEKLYTDEVLSHIKL